MVEKFKFGEPIVQTGAVLNDVSLSNGSLSAGKVTGSWPFVYEYTMDKEEKVFGLGENTRGINKRGFQYISWCSDKPGGNETTQSLYGAHNFIILYGKKITGLFFDNPSRVEFDIGWTEYNTLTVKCDMDGLFVYEITSDKKDRSENLKDVVKQFRHLIGQSYIPPFWGFGFQQSRWGYKNEEDVRNVVKQYKDKNMPLDSVVLDIDYMDQFMDFTVNTERFSNFKSLNDEMAEDGIHLIPIIDAGVKVKDGYSVYEEGKSKGFFCKKADGKEFTAGVWPGRSNFADFFRPEARAWFGSHYKDLTDQGVEGFWNDMNEPALFYSDESLKAVMDKVKNVDSSNLDINSFFEFSGLAGSTANRMDDYQRFYHQVKDVNGKEVTVRHDHVHNMFGAMMTKAAAEGLKAIKPGKRTLIYSRASCIGAHRDGGIWMGDNVSVWTDLAMELRMLPSLNMCGFLYTGADIGGFGDNTSRDLLLRWLSLGVFTPLMRDHSALGTRNQECYAFGDTEDFRQILSLRYALLPYIYSEFVKAAVNEEMMFRPLSFDYPEDKIACDVEDQLMLGNEVMIAPVMQQNARGRYVYLPEDMTEVIWHDYKAEQKKLRKGLQYIEVPLDTVVFFVKKGRCIPLCTKPALRSRDVDYSSIVKIGSGKSYELYRDDGYTTDIKLDGRITLVK